MITVRPPSNLKPYDDFWSGDSAFVQCETTDSESLTEHARRIRQARQTGDWNDLIVPGRSPTKFVMQPLKGEQIRWIRDRTEVGEDRAMGDAVTLALAFRCALVEISNISFESKLTFVDHRNLGKIADTPVTNMLDAHDPSIVSELGAAALMRHRLDPL